MVPSLDRIRIERRAIAPHETLVLDLPFPPSTNNLQRSAPNGVRYDTSEYKGFKAQCAWLLKSTAIRRVPGPIEITLHVQEKSARADIDNRIKSCLDALVTHNIIDGDHASVLRAVHARWSKDVQGVRITISPAREETKRRAA